MDTSTTSIARVNESYDLGYNEDLPTGAPKFYEVDASYMEYD
jgi:hypothetical protein